MLLLEKCFALYVIFLPMLRPKFKTKFFYNFNGGFRPSIRLSLNVQLTCIKAYCSFDIFFSFLFCIVFLRKIIQFLFSFTGALAHHAHILPSGALIKFNITLMLLINREFFQVFCFYKDFAES